MAVHAGGCLCGRVRFETDTDPQRVTTCHCRFCQRATGSAYMVEPIFARESVRVTRGEAATYDHRSAGSGMMVHVHFCRDCGTKLLLTFERFATACGVYAGTFDDPDWFTITPATAKHIFIDVARRETILPAAYPAFHEHATLNDGTPVAPIVLEVPQCAGDITPA